MVDIYLDGGGKKLLGQGIPDAVVAIFLNVA